MSATRADPVADSLAAARAAYDGIDRARAEHRLAVSQFIHEARRAEWTWDRIGRALEVSGNGARRFYERNRGRLSQT